MEQLVELSTRLVVMTERSRAILLAEYKVPENKIDLIVHGIPDRPFADPNFYKEQFGVAGKDVGLTFGLLSPNKGIEHVLQALPAVIRDVPNFVYLILGATHPALVRSEGEKYRISLERMAKELGIQKHVSFYNRFVELHELTEFIGAADLYITPYLNPAQAVSGTLAYAFGCGQAVISTPYWHAEELLADGRGVLVPFADSAAIGREIIALLSDDPRRNAMRKRAYQLGREMTWSHVAALYLKSFQDARRSRILVPKPLAVRTLEEQPLELPRMNLDHLMRMSDSTGILQHACYSIPNNHEGYCTDDNARALVLTVLLEDLGRDSRELHQVASCYAAFLNYAFNPENGRFRNFMSFDRHWMEQDGSDDSLGRAIWALGVCVGRSRRRSFQSWAVQLFERALPASAQATSPRTWALSLIGIHEYLRRLSGDRVVNHMRDTLTNKLVDLYEHSATDDWPWFEDVASYNNAKLPHALILSGRWSGNERAAQSAFDHCGGWQISNSHRRGDFARSDVTAFAAEVSRPPSMTNSLSKHMRWCQLRLKPSPLPTICFGANRRIWHSTGSSAATIWGNPYTTPAPAAATMGCRRIGSTKTKGPNQAWRSCFHWRRWSC